MFVQVEAAEGVEGAAVAHQLGGLLVLLPHVLGQHGSGDGSGDGLDAGNKNIKYS